MKSVGVVVGPEYLEDTANWALNPPWSWTTCHSVVELEDYFGPLRATTEKAFCEAATELEAQGVDLIVSDCSYAVVFQDRVAAAVKTPVCLSVLSLLPDLCETLEPGCVLAIATADAMAFEQVISAVPELERVADKLRAVGMEGTNLHDSRQFGAERELQEILLPRLLAGPPVAAIVLSCTDLVSRADIVNLHQPRPVIDIRTAMADILER